jgi:DUF2939 family protein
MKKVIGLFILFIVIVLGWTAWPYYAVYDFANALDQGDQVALEHRVDWDSVRRGLRDDILSKDDVATSLLANGLVALVGPTVINNIIDSYVTPRGIANLIRSGRPSIPNAAQTENSAADQSSASRLRLHWEQVRYAFFSGGPLTFRVDIASDKTQSGQPPVTLLFKWAGDWKLSRLFLPLDWTAGAEPPRKETQEEIQSRRDVEARAAKELRKRDKR